MPEDQQSHSSQRPNPSGPRGPDAARSDTHPEQAGPELAYLQWINKARKLSLASRLRPLARTSSRPRQVRSDG